MKMTKNLDTPQLSVNIAGVSASMAVEDLNTTKEMLDYARLRLAGKITSRERIAEIVAKYKND